MGGGERIGKASTRQPEKARYIRERKALRIDDTGQIKKQTKGGVD